MVFTLFICSHIFDECTTSGNIVCKRNVSTTQTEIIKGIEPRATGPPFTNLAIEFGGKQEPPILLHGIVCVMSVQEYHIIK